MDSESDLKLADSKKEKPYFSLSKTQDAVKLVNWIRRKYAKAQMDLDPREDGPLNELGDSQMLRAGLIKLKDSMEASEPGEIIAMIDCAGKRRGPHTNTAETEKTNTATQTPPNGDAVRAHRRSA